MKDWLAIGFMSAIFLVFPDRSYYYVEGEYTVDADEPENAQL